VNIRSLEIDIFEISNHLTHNYDRGDVFEAARIVMDKMMTGNPCKNMDNGHRIFVISGL
jgi:hypothetical protein